MKEFTIAALMIGAFSLGGLLTNSYHTRNLTCAQAVLHNDVAKCSVYIVKDVMR